MSAKAMKKTTKNRTKRRARKWNATQRTVVRTVNQVTPDEVDVILTYPAAATLLNAAGTLKAQRWTPNAAYDVDPVLGSTSTPGFAEWAALYTYYRVVSYSIDAEVANLEAFPITVYSINSNVDPHTIGSGYIDYQTQPYSKVAIVGAVSGKGTVRFKHNVSVSKLLGSNAVDTADSLRSLTNAVPADLVYYAIGLFSVTGANMANGVMYQVNIKMNVKFYGRQNLLTSFLPTRAEFDKVRNFNKATKDFELKHAALQERRAIDKARAEHLAEVTASSANT